METTIRRYTDFEEMKADEYRYWQSQSVHRVSRRCPNLPTLNTSPANYYPIGQMQMYRFDGQHQAPFGEIISVAGS